VSYKINGIFCTAQKKAMLRFNAEFLPFVQFYDKDDTVEWVGGLSE
jgi:hypothetical protein